MSRNQRIVPASGIEKSVQRNILEVGIDKEPRLVLEVGKGGLISLFSWKEAGLYLTTMCFGSGYFGNKLNL